MFVHEKKRFWLVFIPWREISEEETSLIRGVGIRQLGGHWLLTIPKYSSKVRRVHRRFQIVLPSGALLKSTSEDFSISR